METERTPAERLDDVWLSHRAGAINLTEGIREMRAILDDGTGRYLTELGAEEMLKNHVRPSERHLKTAMEIFQ